MLSKYVTKENKADKKSSDEKRESVARRQSPFLIHSLAASRLGSPHSLISLLAPGAPELLAEAFLCRRRVIA